MKLAAVATVMSIVATVGLVSGQQAGAPIEYESFCKMSVESKRSAFNATTPDNRALLVRTQIERWRDANKPRLNEKQLELLGELVAIATPAAYGGGAPTQEAQDKMRSLEARLRELFTIDDVRALQPSGPCIAKSKS